MDIGVARVMSWLPKEILDALWKGDEPRVARFLGQLADVNMRDDFGKSLLMAACEAGVLSSVMLLLKAGADVNAADAEGCSPLIYSCIDSDNSAIISELLNRNADIDWSDRLGRTALICASTGHVENVRAILRCKPRIDAVTLSDETALSFSVVWGCIDIVRCLLEAGADLDWRDSRGWSVLDYAEYGGNAKVIHVIKSFIGES